MINGLVPPSKTLQRQAKVAECFRKVWPQVERRTAATNRAFQLAQGTINLGEVGVEGWHVRLQGHGSTNQRHGTRLISLLMVQHTQQVKRNHIGFFLAQDSLI